MQRLLAKKHEVVIAESGGEALAHLSANNDFDVIVCDLMMPDMDGEMLYDSICESFPSLKNKFIFVTGGVFTPKLSQFLNKIKEFHLYLYKPVSEEEMSEAIKKVLAKKSN